MGLTGYLAVSDPEPTFLTTGNGAVFTVSPRLNRWTSNGTPGHGVFSPILTASGGMETYYVAT